MICSTLYTHIFSMCEDFLLFTYIRYQTSLVIAVLQSWTSGRTKIETLRRCAFFPPHILSSEEKPTEI